MVTMKPYICYCFKYTEDDIIKNLNENQGESTILDKIADSKREDLCNCEKNHPEHRCCLTDVHRVVDSHRSKNINLDLG